MKLPPTLRDKIETRFGTVSAVRPVQGGSIGAAVRVEAANRVLFAKVHARAPAGFFAAEVRGLTHLQTAGSDLHVPEVLGYRDAEHADDVAWLLLEWLEPIRAGDGYHECLGRGLAALHRDAGRGRWGDNENGYIGTLPQNNEFAEPWAQFWRSRRLEPQLSRARAAKWPVGSAAQWAELLDRLPDVLAPARADGPSLVHGDLWSGNVFATAGAAPVLIDPAAYWGHREVDLAMAKLFGGFSSAFFSAYEAAWELQPGFWRERCAIYQLYYLLVHVNLFGGSYAEKTRRTLGAALKGSEAP